MKPILVLPPAAALIVVSMWLTHSRRTITSLEEQSTALRQRLAARASGVPDETASLRPDAPAKTANEKKPIEWKEFAAQMMEMQRGGGMGDIRTMLRIQARLQAMTRDEIVAALDEITTLGLSEDEVQLLEQTLMGPLCEKDPEFALTRYAGRLNDEQGSISWQLANAMKQWAMKDPAKATAWFDQQIAEGKFISKSLDGKSGTRLQFEGSLIGSLISTDPDAASGRLQALPEDQRKELLRNYTGNAVKDEDQLAFATLVRKELDQDDQVDTLASLASQRSWGEGFEKTDEFLDRIEATPDERAAAVGKVADQKVGGFMRKKKVTREDIDGLREWATTQAPDVTDKVTGQALARATQGGNKALEFSEAAAMAVEYHESSGNDDVLESFLTRDNLQQHQDEARVLAEKISDPTRRDAILKQLK